MKDRSEGSPPGTAEDDQCGVVAAELERLKILDCSKNVFKD
jgi:hypothetical protein